MPSGHLVSNKLWYFLVQLVDAKTTSNPVWICYNTSRWHFPEVQVSHSHYVLSITLLKAHRKATAHSGSPLSFLTIRQDNNSSNLSSVNTFLSTALKIFSHVWDSPYLYYEDMQTFLGLEILEISIPGCLVFGVLKCTVHIFCTIMYCFEWYSGFGPYYFSIFGTRSVRIRHAMEHLTTLWWVNWNTGVSHSGSYPIKCWSQGLNSHIQIPDSWTLLYSVLPVLFSLGTWKYYLLFILLVNKKVVKTKNGQVSKNILKIKICLCSQGTVCKSHELMKTQSYDVKCAEMFQYKKVPNIIWVHNGEA